MAGFCLRRFLDAQGPALPIAMRELRARRKETHWMWFVFPQLRSLGRSTTALHYGIGDLAEARAYFAHPLLGPRLVACAQILLIPGDRTALQILGHPDDVKLQACMTLFAEAAPEVRVFQAVLDRYFEGAHHPETVHDLSPG